MCVRAPRHIRTQVYVVNTADGLLHFGNTVWWSDPLDRVHPLCGSENSSSQDEEHNVDNVLLYSFAHFEHSPLLQSYLLDVELCKSALTCRFALDVISLYVKSELCVAEVIYGAGANCEACPKAHRCIWFPLPRSPTCNIRSLHAVLEVHV